MAELNLSDPADVEKLYRAVIEKYGWESQADAIIEECSELIQAICKHRRKAAQGKFSGKALDALIEEMADVEIVLAQAKIIYLGESPQAEKVFEEVKKRKLAKLAGRLEITIS